MLNETKKFLFKIQILLAFIWLPWCFLTISAQNISSGTVTIAAQKRGNPFVNFMDGKTLAGDTADLTAKGAVAPLGLTCADFDADGVPDLATVYKTTNGGLISINRGNVESVFPKNSDLSPAPFFAEAQNFDLSFAPDFFAAGDFNADGKQDLLAAERGTNLLVLLAGNGAISFAAPQTVELNGEITALAVGEMNNFDNLPDVAVGITENGSSKILIFQSSGGAFAEEPKIIKTRRIISTFVFGELDGKPSRDLIAAADNELIFVSGNVSGKIKNENVSRRKIDFQVAALAVGDFAGERENEIAVLSKNGELKVWTSDFKRLISRIRTPSENVAQSFLLAAKVSTRQKTDLIFGGADNLKLVFADDANNLSAAAEFDTNGAPIAVLPMRLNKDALADLVIITENQLDPSFLLTAPTTIRTVSSLSDSGSGSLRKAIEDANASPGLDEIRFAVSNADSPINAQSDLPEITDAATLDATTQNGFNNQPIIELGSTFSGSNGTTPMIRLTASNSVVRGFIVKPATFRANIIRIDGDNNFIEGNFIGTNRTGTASSGDARNGIAVFSAGNTIGGATVQARNVISGVTGANFANGITISGGSNRVKGNYIGTDKSGLNVLGNDGSGVSLTTAASGNVVGGEADTERNIISGNTLSGISVNPPPDSYSDIVIENNFIGTNKNGDAALGNAGGGIRLENLADVAPTATVQVFGNVISGNTGDGLYYGINPRPHSELHFVPGGDISDTLILGRHHSTTNPLLDSPGNRIGVNASGTAALPNTGNGVRLENSPSRIEGNTISANGASGIRITSAEPFGSLIADNFIGTDSAGNTALGNGNGGIRIDTENFPTSETQQTKIYDNVISGNTGDGVYAVTTNTSLKSNVAPQGDISDGLILGRRPAAPNPRPEIEAPGNRIGTNAAGTAALPNTGNGINLQDTGAKIDGNIISANAVGGLNSVLLSARAATQITNNFIGTDTSGNNDLGNGANGITLEFGGALPTTEIYDNVISGNTGDGVYAVNTSGISKLNAAPEGDISDGLILGRRQSNPNPLVEGTIPGNHIGLNAAGTAALGNSGNGVFINNVPTKIGGADIADGNQIAYNGANGIVIAGGAGNLILSNAIFSNALRGIDLGGDGVTLNDLGDADTGANNLQNYPVLTSAASNGSSTNISGVINTTPNTDLNIQFYAVSGAATGGGDPFGTFAVRSDASGNASFSAAFPVGISSGNFVSATATTAESNAGNRNNTSEFSPGVTVFAPTAANVSVAGRVLTVDGRAIARVIVSLTSVSGETRSATTNSFGYYKFNEVPSGTTYILSARTKGFTFTNLPRVISVFDEIGDADIIGSGN
jgi:hypothetical protein